MGNVGRKQLVARLKRLGFTGPFAGGNHQFMRRGSVKVILPNPHRSDISAGLLARILKQAGVSEEEWGASR